MVKVLAVWISLQYYELMSGLVIPEEKRSDNGQANLIKIHLSLTS